MKCQLILSAHPSMMLQKLRSPPVVSVQARLAYNLRYSLMGNVFVCQS